MRTWLRAVLCASALAFQACGQEVVTLLDKPVTATVALPKLARGAQALLLQLEKVTAPQEGPVTFNIFAELPSADAATSVDHPNFVGYVTLLANPRAPINPPKGMTIQVADPAARLIEGLPSARFTFVPSAKFPGKGVRIGSIRLEVVGK